MTYRRKLIEVALPLEAINREAAREKNIRHGHPATLHLWWARRPLAACRAVLFAQLVDDPSSRPDEFPTVESQDAERWRLFRLIEQLVVWENASDPTLLGLVRTEILKSADGNLPTVVDPFCGGGAIPLEAQRLGLSVQASDLNPVAVLINKALIEIPGSVFGRGSVHPETKRAELSLGERSGTTGLATDIRQYGEWIASEAYRRLGRHYPDVALPTRGRAPIIAWLWARTVTCPNPACRSAAPLVRSFVLGRKKGKETWVVPIPDALRRRVGFRVQQGPGAPPSGTVGRAGATCLICGSPISLAHIRGEGKAGRLGAQLMATVAEGDRRRTYLQPDEEPMAASQMVRPTDGPDTELPAQALGFRVQAYGMFRHSDLFSDRQLTLAIALASLVSEARKRIATDCADEKYADDVATYLAFAVDRVIASSSTLCTWNSNPKNENLRDTFARPTISMSWDYAEANVFGPSSGSLRDSFDWVAKAVERLPGGPGGHAHQADATAPGAIPAGALVCTDPPYYDNVGYADLSDYFYIWLRRSLSPAYPDLLSTVLTPKASELIADPARNGGDSEVARDFFEAGFRRAFELMRESADPRFPMTVFYAFKQAEEEGDGDERTIASTGWETMLEGLIQAGLTVTGTWPMRTERGGRMREVASNALASSIVLVCRPRSAQAPITDRRGFIAALKRELPKALRDLQQGAIAPVDLAQASIGPGMAIFSQFSRIIEPTGDPMSVRAALGLINQVLDEVLAEQEGEFDADTRWSIAWFTQYGFDIGPYGMAETLSRARNTSVDRLKDAAIVVSGAGSVRLVGPDELSAGHDPAHDDRVTVWGATLQLVRQMDTNGEVGAADLARNLGGLGDAARALAYRLYTVSERRGWTKNAMAFNALVVAWPEISRLAATRTTAETQSSLFEG